MNRHDWLTSTDPAGMLLHLRQHSLSDGRKLRLFAVACVRRSEIWGRLTVRDRQAVETVERRADAGWERQYGEQPRAFWEGLSEPVYNLGWNEAGEAATRTIGACGCCGLPTSLMADLLRETAGDPFWPMATQKNYHVYAVTRARIVAAAHAIQDRSGRSGREGDVIYCRALSSMILPDACLIPTVLALAETTWSDRDFTRLPIIADALEDAGCPTAEMCWNCQGTGSDGILMIYDKRKYILGDPDFAVETKPATCNDCEGTGKTPSRLLAHLRDLTARHVLGCWALDLVLGKG